MRAITATEPGGPQALRLGDHPDPEAGPGDLLVDVAAAGVNRADLMQREGKYPPPPGASDVLGLEVSGTVAAVGADVTSWAVGDQVCAVVPGGGYAERIALPASTAMPLPPGVDLVSAAAVPEVFTTAFDNVLVRARLAAGERLLVHGGASGVGTAAIQLGVRAGARVLVTASSAARLDACGGLGAHVGIDYTTQDFVAEVAADTDGAGVDVILDVVGGPYLARNLEALALEGRLVVIAVQGGARAELDLGALMRRRQRVLGSTLRAREVDERATLARRMVAEVWPGFADGALRPVMHARYRLAQAAAAHEEMEAGRQIGKILLVP